LKRNKLKMEEIKTSPTVSVIIPTYNRAHMVGRAIQSVLAQTYQGFELIVADDASTDNTEEVVKSFNDERLKYIRHEENSGTSAAPRNTGIKMARGEYIALLDSDDEWLPEKLEKQLDRFKSVSPDIGVVYCGFFYVSERTGRTLFEVAPAERGDVFELITAKHILGDTTPLVKKECFQKAGVYDTEFLSCQSWDMWIRVARHHKFDFVPEILAKFYIHGNQNVTSLKRRIQGLDRITRKYQNYLPKTLASNRLGYLGSLCCYQGDLERANRYFREAISNNRRGIYNYIRLLLCKFVPRLYQARLRKLHAKSDSRYGGITVW